MNTEAIAAALVAVPILVGIIQAIKAQFDDLPGGLIPLVAVALGIAFTVGGAASEPGSVQVGDPTMFAQIVAGIVLGLASSGFYDVSSTGVGTVAAVVKSATR
jgi:hypothetical protein